jgi:hypothetical protein
MYRILVGNSKNSVFENEVGYEGIQFWLILVTKAVLLLHIGGFPY